MERTPPPPTRRSFPPSTSTTHPSGPKPSGVQADYGVPGPSSTTRSRGNEKAPNKGKGKALNTSQAQQQCPSAPSSISAEALFIILHRLEILESTQHRITIEAKIPSAEPMAPHGQSTDSKPQLTVNPEEPTAHSSQERPSVPRSQRSPKFKDPPMFSGRTSLTVETWSKLMQFKLLANVDWYPTEELRMGFIFSFTEGKAQEILNPLYKSNHPLAFTTSAEMMECLSQCFGVLDRSSEAHEHHESLYPPREAGLWGVQPQ